MIPLTAGQIAEIVEGVLHGEPRILVTGSPTLDSRNVQPGALFLAFEGDHVDGHDFSAQAHAAGASLTLSSNKVESPCVVVPDVARALGRLASYVRNELADLIVIGITGSQGKTTTKDLLTQVLAMVGKTVSPQGSLNNDLGVPLTLLNCTRETRFCILEMGARHRGDIERLCKISRPNIGVVLIVGSAHIGEFGSVEVIAETKSELIRNIVPGGIAVLGQYDAFTPKMSEGLPLRTLLFGQTHQATVRATDVDLREGRAHFDLVTPAGREPVALRLIGEHQIANALAVAAICTGLEIPIEVIAGALSTAEIASRWRMEILEVSDMLFINDAYNANPESTKAALRSLTSFAQARGGQSWAFLGKMHELGAISSDQHAHVGEFAGFLGVDHLVCVGTAEYSLRLTDFPDTQIHQFSSKIAAADLVEYFSQGDVALIKGSRTEKMEELAEELMKRWTERASEQE